jgi:hypothetical protein
MHLNPRALTLVLILGVASLALSGAATAWAAPIKECGNQEAGGEWTYDEISGAGVYNLTSRVISCRAARRVVSTLHHAWDGPSIPRHVTVFGYRYTCRLLSQAVELFDIRCTARRGRVARWQEGS